MNQTTLTRRSALLGAAGAAASMLGASPARAASPSTIGGIHAIPELAAHWKELDLAEILSRPAAYCSVSQNKSCYDEGGVQATEGHRKRGSLEATREGRTGGA